MNKNIANILIIGGIILIFLVSFVIYNEIHGAKSFCDEVNGSYHLEIDDLNVEHQCDGEKIAKYPNGWRFYIDFNNITIELPKS